MSEELSFDLSLSPGHLLHRAQQFAADRFNEATGGVQITQRQFAVMTAVAAEEGLTQTQLVKVTGIDRSTLAELVARMTSKGLLRRDKAPGDARANSVSFTQTGRALYETALAGAKQADEAILSALPKGKRGNFVESLTRIARTIEMDAEALQAEAQKAKAADRKKTDGKSKKKHKKKHKKK